jgi:internalin A
MARPDEAAMPVQPKPASRSPRRLLRLSVRGLIVLVLLLGGSMGWIVRSARIQHDAVAAIMRAGGLVKYDQGWTKTNMVHSASAPKPGWLVNRIGVDYLSHVKVVWLNASLVGTDLTLEQVGRLTSLQQLRLDESSVSDAGLAHLSALGNLAQLNLEGTHISDAGLAHLKGLTKLSILDIDGTRVTDAGLVHLEGLTNLSTLRLDGTRVTDAGLVHLKRLTNLSELSLSGSKVTDAGVKELQKALPRLKISQ